MAPYYSTMNYCIRHNLSATGRWGSLRRDFGQRGRVTERPATNSERVQRQHSQDGGQGHTFEGT